ncbi:hypothetical protein IPH92_01235 [Candidatus Kaiserbacteria bacterium]|nr:MAG: hypothetical protein IPH92_01235 [Candidatus Kaiserbacteria bacterium]
MFNLRHNSSDTVYGVLVDISSGTVGIAIVASPKGAKLPQLIYTHRNTMRITEHGSEKSENIRRVREALFSASLILSQEGKQVLNEFDSNAVITKMYVTCSSPWSYTVARTVHFEDNVPFRITNSIINDLIQSAESEILNHIRGVEHVTSNGFSIVERATVDITVNDYPVVHPLNLKGTILGLSHITGLVPQEILDAVNEVQEKLFTETELRTHTYMLIMYCVLRDIFPRLNTLCIVDITGEETEFAIVENGLLIENSSVPVGSNTFIREIMKSTGKPSADIQSHMSLVGNEAHLNAAEFTPHIESYKKQISETLSQLLEHRSIPADIVITAHKPFERFFAPIIENVFKDTIKNEPRILSISQNIIDEISHGAGDDVYLALGARFFHKLHGCSELHYE